MTTHPVSSPRRRAGRAWPRRLRAGAALAALTALAPLLALAAGCSQSDEDDASDTGAVELYRAEVDEGLGASVAILIDNSGSMEEPAAGDERPKFVVAREALAAMLAATDSFVARQPDFPINVGLYSFATDVQPLVPVKRYDREALRAALDAMHEPEGGTAIGDAMEAARADLYRAGTFRKYLLVVTDGENTVGRSPRRVAREIARRSEGSVRMYFVAFDIDAEEFAFVRDVRGEVVGAANAEVLRASLDTIYRGKILAEALDAGETLPDSLRDSLARRGADRGRGADSARGTGRPPQSSKEKTP